MALVGRRMFGEPTAQQSQEAMEAMEDNFLAQKNEDDVSTDGDGKDGGDGNGARRRIQRGKLHRQVEERKDGEKIEFDVFRFEMGRRENVLHVFAFPPTFESVEGKVMQPRKVQKS